MAGWPAALVLAGVMTTLLVPPSLLQAMHVNYVSPNGAAWEKVHPGSDLILAGVLGAALRSGAPLSWLVRRSREMPGTVAFLAATGFLTFYAIAVLHTPFTPLIDTFLVPAVTLLALCDLAPGWKARLEMALHLFVAGNALLGIAEFMSGWRLVPAEVDGVVQTAAVESRAFGLLGHPLTSAAMAGLYAVVLMIGGGRRLPPAWRLPALALQALALGAFGGRTALVMTVAIAIGLAGMAALRFLAGRAADLRLVGATLLAAPLAIAALGAVAASGFFDNVLGRFAEDNGSAIARQAILEVPRYLSWPELLFGPEPDHLTSIQHLLGIEVGVESFWFGLAFSDGLLPALVLFAGFLLFLLDILRRCGPAAWLPMLFFIGIISTSLSLSSKSAMLEQFVVVIVILMPRMASQPRPVTALAAALA